MLEIKVVLSLTTDKSLQQSRSTPSRLYATLEVSRKMRRGLKTIRDLKDDARDIRHDISLHNQSINTNHTTIVEHTLDVKDGIQDIKCTIAHQKLDFESKEKIKARESKKKEVLR
ncbi:hypothetical protein BOTNAR_0138g00170 [Botryotinia narcissicola]|uniref:Uncharacterized protein n=1 Tax=Botryotinia narcissicola TaxID=278944 RepID=A0A4Z1INR3_9HELO|nr:hypothetical protein BOTNAR_0138g00170 [Botryotinia narcissicola]